jgi:hypothetical protein
MRSERRQTLVPIKPHQTPSNSPSARILNTLQSILLLLALDLNLDALGTLLAFRGSLLDRRLLDGSLLTVIIITGGFGFLRSAFGFLVGSALVDAAGRASSSAGRDLGALERVPAGAQGAAVLVAELEGDFFDVELWLLGVCFSQVAGRDSFLVDAEDGDGNLLFLWLAGRYRFTYLDLGGEILHNCADELGFVVGEVGAAASAGSAWDVGVLHGGCWMDGWMSIRCWRCSTLLVRARERLSRTWMVLGFVT